MRMRTRTEMDEGDQDGDGDQWAAARVVVVRFRTLFASDSHAGDVGLCRPLLVGRSVAVPFLSRDTNLRATCEAADDDEWPCQRLPASQPASRIESPLLVKLTN